MRLPVLTTGTQTKPPVYSVGAVEWPNFPPQSRCASPLFDDEQDMRNRSANGWRDFGFEDRNLCLGRGGYLKIIGRVIRGFVHQRYSDLRAWTDAFLKAAGMGLDSALPVIH